MKIETRLRLDSIPGRFLVIPVLVATGLAGCGSPTPEPAPAPAPKAAAAPAANKPASDLDDVPINEADVAKPKSYAEAVTRIEGYRNNIRDEIAAGRPTKAHRGLDELDIVLNWLPGVARDNGVPKEQWEKVNTTAKAIQDLFNQVHSRIDDKKEPDYASVSAAIDKAVADLKTVTASGSASKAEPKP